MLHYWRTTIVVNASFAFVVALFGDDRALVGSNRCADVLNARSLRSGNWLVSFAFPVSDGQTSFHSLSLFCPSERSTHVRPPPKNSSDIAQTGRDVAMSRQTLRGTTRSPRSGNSGRSSRPFG